MLRVILGGLTRRSSVTPDVGGLDQERFNTSDSGFIPSLRPVSHSDLSLFHHSPWPYNIFQRGFDLVMGEQPSDRIFR